MLPEVLSFCNEQTEVGLAHLSQSGNGGKIFLHYILLGMKTFGWILMPAVIKYATLILDHKYKKRDELHKNYHSTRPMLNHCNIIVGSVMILH